MIIKWNENLIGIRGGRTTSVRYRLLYFNQWLLERGWNKTNLVKHLFSKNSRKFFSLKSFILYVCMCTSVCMCGCLWGSYEYVESLGAGVTCGRDLPEVGAENWTQLFCKIVMCFWQLGPIVGENSNIIYLWNQLYKKKKGKFCKRFEEREVSVLFN